MLPVLWLYSDPRLAGLGRFRRWFAILLRTAVVTLLVLASADLQLVRTNDNLTCSFFLDQSFSIPEQGAAAMIRLCPRGSPRASQKQDRVGG